MGIVNACVVPALVYCRWNNCKGLAINLQYIRSTIFIFVVIGGVPATGNGTRNWAEERHAKCNENESALPPTICYKGCVLQVSIRVAGPIYHAVASPFESQASRLRSPSWPSFCLWYILTVLYVISVKYLSHVFHPHWSRARPVVLVGGGVLAKLTTTIECTVLFPLFMIFTLEQWVTYQIKFFIQTFRWGSSLTP